MFDPDKDVLVTSSATEGLYVACQAYINPGDEARSLQFSKKRSTLLSVTAVAPANTRTASHAVELGFKERTQSLAVSPEQVIVFEPIFPWYVTHIRMAGGIPVPVRLDPPDFALDPAKLRAAFSERTKMVIYNTPHNPTGHVLTRAESEMLAAECVKHNVIVISDEVYERKAWR